MKFSRILPRPLETFHSVDEKRPWITFTKTHSGGFSTFSSSFFSPSPLLVEYNFTRLVFWEKKRKEKKKRSLQPPPRCRGSKGVSKKTIEWRGRRGWKRNEEGEARTESFHDAWTPPSKTRTNPELGHHLVNVDRFTNIRGREQTVEERFYEIFNLQTSITIYATANHPDPCQTAPPFLRTFCHVSSHDSSSAIRHMDPRLRTETRCIKLSCRYIR